MAKNITLMGASYSAVPAVTLPKTGGGTARFDDASVTTATAADVASGKVFLAANGQITTGTASGGGGASNFVTGTFTTGSTAGAIANVTIPYTGAGYPIALVVVVEGGAYNSNVSPWYSAVRRYAVGQWTFTKAVMTSTPTFDDQTSNTANQGVTTWVYKSSSSSATTYSRSSAMNTPVLTNLNPSNTGANCVKFKNDGKTLAYTVSSTTYGLLASTTYRYFVVYSS